MVHLKTKERLVTGDSKITTDYFQWLCEEAGIGNGPCSYYFLAKELHERRFQPGNIPHDVNRAGDGMALRDEYAYNGAKYPEYLDLAGPCSMLEMLIGVAKRMDFLLAGTDDADEHVDRYFFELIRNLGLEEYADDVFVELDGRLECDFAITRLIFRTYDPDGHGGLFPLRHAREDQRDVEIWYQMQAYIMERY